MSKPTKPVIESGGPMSDIFNGSIALTGICLLILTLFQVTDKSALYWVDECFYLTAAGYLLTTVSAYLCLRKPDQDYLRPLTDRLFLFSLGSTVLSIGILIYEFQAHA
ncbi:MAG: hypothetical protein RIC30_14915 [Marinoscillum sp.]|uniref:hypothetical protein n=1 Tax=Marinoscillum sp. TaxID=2024838 RepID=UPI003300D4B5